MTNDKRKPSDDVGLPVGTKIGKYEVRERLGIGGQAIVYKCHDPLLDRDVAVKQVSTHLAADPKFLDRFRGEAKILARLGAEQAAIVTIHELVEDEHGLFIVMEHVPGHTLETILSNSDGPIEPKAVLQILWRLAGALHAVHAAGIIHRDIKPANILIGEGLRPKITDFGVAASMTGGASMPLGTTRYMAPELFEGGKADARVDVYSLGFVTYEMLIGRRKFNEIFADVIRDPHSEVLRWMKWHGNRAVQAPKAHEVNPAVPAQLGEIVARMMAKDRNQRHASMEELGRAIRTEFSPRGRAKGAAAAVAMAAGAMAASAPTPPVGPQEAAGSAPAGGPPGLDAENLQIQPPDIPQPVAVGAGEQGAGVPVPAQGPATAPIPKRTLSRRTKLFIVAGIGAAVLVAGVVMLLVRSGRQEELQRQRAAQFNEAKTSLEAAMPPVNDRAKFAEALKGYEQVRERFANTKAADRASVMAPICEAYLAVIDQDWETAATQRQTARQRIDSIQAKYAEKGGWSADSLDAWVSEKRLQIQSLEDHQTDSRRFAVRRELARILMDAVDEIQQARDALESGAVSSKLVEVQQARRSIESAREVGDEKAGPLLRDAAASLVAAEDKLRALREPYDPNELKERLSVAKLGVVEQAEKMAALLRDLRRTHKQGELVAAYENRVQAADTAIKDELAELGRREVAMRVRKEEGAIDRFRRNAVEQLKSAEKLAEKGQIEGARKIVEDAGRIKEDLFDYELPGELPGRDLEKLKEYKSAAMGAIDANIQQTTQRIAVAEENWKDILAYRRALEAVSIAKGRKDWAAALQSLQRALELGRRVKPEDTNKLTKEMASVKLRIDLDRALKLKSAGKITQAIKALKDYLNRNPNDSVAQAALKDAEGQVRWGQLLQQADGHRAGGRWQQALTAYEQAKQIRFTSAIGEHIRECKYQIGMAEGDKLFAQGKLEEAVAAYEGLRAVKPSAGPIINDRLEKVDRRQRYNKLYTAAVEAQRKRAWLDARRLAGEAAKIYPNDAELSGRAEEVVRQASYSEWMAKGKSQMAAQQYKVALAYFNNAKRYARGDRETYAVEEQIQAATRAIEAEENG